MDYNPKILVVGSVNMDICMEITRFPLEGESLVGTRYHLIPGGKGSNQAVGAALQGAEVCFFGKVGNDPNGVALRESLKKKGVDTRFLFVDNEVPTGLAAVMVGEHGKNRIIIFLGSNASITSGEVAAAFENMHYDAMIIQFEVSQNTVIEACRLARERGIPVILDAGPAVDFPLEQIAGMEILSPNQTEALKLCGIEITSKESAVEAAKLLRQRSKAKYVVIKMSQKGSMLYDGETAEFFQPTPVQPVDPTAAGDVFTSAMTVEYLRGGDIRSAIRYANLAGAVTVTKLGAQTSIPTRAEVAGFARAHGVHDYGG